MSAADSLGAMSAEQFYVSASRGKAELTVYTGSKRDLLRAVERAEDRPTATDFVMGRDHRERALRLHRSAATLSVPPQMSPERNRPIEREA